MVKSHLPKKNIHPVVTVFLAQFLCSFTAWSESSRVHVVHVPLFKGGNARCEQQLKKNDLSSQRFQKIAGAVDPITHDDVGKPRKLLAKSRVHRSPQGAPWATDIAVGLQFDEPKKRIQYLVGGFSPTHLKNMRTSNWIMKPQDFRGEHSKKCLSCHHQEYYCNKILLLPPYPTNLEKVPFHELSDQLEPAPSSRNSNARKQTNFNT